MSDDPRKLVRKGRGALSNAAGRFEMEQRSLEDDGWGSLELAPAKIHTTLTRHKARRVISRNASPDVPFSQSINPYQGCEHGCIYCFARPTHAFLGLSPGLDFETKLFFKPDAASILEQELAHPHYCASTIALGANTDPYQPAERRARITRQLLEVLSQCHHPVAIVTKSALVERDVDLLAPMAERGLASVCLSVTTLDTDLARRMEPRANSPERRLRAIETLSAHGIPTSALAAPVIPALNDEELERILAAVHTAGALDAHYVTLRLPLELNSLFQQWLEEHYPNRAKHVMARVHDLHHGRAYRADFGTRMTGTGIFASLIARRFHVAKKKLGFAGVASLDCSLFQPPRRQRPQLELF